MKMSQHKYDVIFVIISPVEEGLGQVCLRVGIILNVEPRTIYVYICDFCK